jgi:TolB-like protein/Tfp pilus assembly protein PilF
MEYVEGEPLDKVLARGDIGLDQVTDIGRQMARGLAAAHNAGLIHRDLKPSNLILDKTGQVKLVDFGLAGLAGTNEQASSDSRSGTLPYMSPEQLNGEEATAASDLFSLGVVLYELITGRRPFTGDYDAAIVYAIVNDEPPAIDSLVENVPVNLQDAIGRLLAKDPGERYRDAEDLLTDLGDSKARQPASPSLRMGHSARRVVLSLAVAVLATFAAWYLWPVTSHGPAALGSRSLAVLPFDNLGATEDQYFAEGVADAITTDLARIGDLSVISRTSAMKYSNTDKGVRTVGGELGCRYLITGTVHWDRDADPDRVRVHARLVDVAEDTHLWADSYDSELGDIFALQSAIARDVAAALQTVLHELGQPEVVGPPTINLEAYDFYLRGNQYFNRSWERDDIEIATVMYAQAVELDPDFALAHAMLSRGHESMYWEYFDHTTQRKELARQEAQRALELQPGLVEGHIALGYYYYHCELDYEKALEEFELALARWPNHAELISAVGAVQRRIGPMELAAASFIRASRLDPRSHLKLFDVGLTLGLMRQYERAEVWLDKAIQLAPDWPIPHVYKAWLEIFRDGNVAAAREILGEASRHVDLNRSQYYWWLARIVEPDLAAVLQHSRPGADTVVYYLHCAQMHRSLGNPDLERSFADSARVILEERILEFPDNARFQSHLGLAYAGLRDKERAMEHSGRAMQLLPATRDAFDALFYALNHVETCVVLGERERAIEQLHFLLSIPGFVSPSYLRLDPLWQPLHDHPGWADLVRQAESR